MVLRQILPEMVAFFLEVAGDEERMEDVVPSSWTQRVLKYLADLKAVLATVFQSQPEQVDICGAFGGDWKLWRGIHKNFQRHPYCSISPSTPLSSLAVVLRHSVCLFPALSSVGLFTNHLQKGLIRLETLSTFSTLRSMSSFPYWSFSVWNDGIGSIPLGPLLPLRLGLAFSTGYCHSSMQVPLPLAR